VTVTPEASQEQTPSHDAQRAWETRMGPRAGAAAVLSAALLVAGFAYQVSSHAAKSKNSAEYLQKVHLHPSDNLITGCLGAAALFLLPVVLVYLYRVIKYRRPQIPAFVVILSVIGPVLLGAAGVAYQIDLVHVAKEFVALPAAQQTKKTADNMLDGTALKIYGLGFTFAGLSVAASLVFLNLNAMRAGLVTRFLGVVGIIAGVLFVLGGPAQILELFWLLAMGAILLNRWPGGRGPAWAALEERPWPSSMETRLAAAQSKRGMGAATANGTPPPVEAHEDDDGPNPNSRKRKRKKRR
jgi:Domain of unknown function (DUF4386)